MENTPDEPVYDTRVVKHPALLGRIVRLMREHRQMEIDDLAQAANIEPSAISCLERAQAGSLTSEDVEALADALHTTHRYFYELAYGSPPTSPEEIWSRYTRVTENTPSITSAALAQEDRSRSSA